MNSPRNFYINIVFVVFHCPLVAQKIKKQYCSYKYFQSVVRLLLIHNALDISCSSL